MERIASFNVDHNKLNPGIYVSRIDADIITYDLRTRKPNAGDYMDNRTMHSVEHLFATFIRNSELSEKVIYFGPMGCQTGFYLVMRDVKNDEVLELVLRVLNDIIEYNGEMPGGSAIECGNYRNLSVEDAKVECKKYIQVLKTSNNDFKYAE